MIMHFLFVQIFLLESQISIFCHFMMFSSNPGKIVKNLLSNK